MKRLVCLLLLSAHVVPQTVQKSSPNDQDLTAEQKNAVVRLANLQKNFGRITNSPGVELSLREVKRSRTSDRTLVTYQLYTTGLPKDLTYNLLQVQINGKVLRFIDGVTLDSDGRAICAGRKGTCSGKSPNSPIDLVFFAGKTEPKRLSLVSNDSSQLKGFIAVVPFPNETTDKGCRLESIIGTPKGEVTYVQGSGFEPNEELIMNSESYGEKNHGTAKAEADGSYFAVAMPNILGKASGNTVWEVKGKNCDPKLTFSWGSYQLE
ncbi:MAG: hypothetical protein WAM87_01330 [Terriglobales bacterium]|jgi:hypothetical protein